MINLSSSYAVPAGDRLLVVSAVPDDEVSVLSIKLRLETAAGVLLGAKTIKVVNGACDQVTRGTLQAGVGTERALEHGAGVLDMPTGYDDALAVWRTWATPAERNKAIEMWALGAAVIDPSFGGAVVS